MLTATQLYNLQCPPKNFRTADVTEHFGSVGVVTSDWSTDRVDWLVTGIAFASVRRRDRGHNIICGPFQVKHKEGVFTVLETVDGKEFCHPRFFKKEGEHSTTYMTTAALVWTRECLCDKNQDDLIENYCFCAAILQRDFCLVCPTVHRRIQEIKEDAAVDSVLSQNTCICTTYFGDGIDGFCGYRQTKDNEAISRMKQTTINLKPAPSPMKPARKTRTVIPKDLDVSLTVGIAGEDVTGETFDRLATFIQQHAKMGMISFERGDSHLLFQRSFFMIAGGPRLYADDKIVRMLKQEIRKAIGWMDDGPLGGSICVKSLRDTGLHTIVGIIGYCLKDEKEEHFRMFQKNVTDRQMNEGRRMHGIYGASEFKNRLQLTPMNILTRALQYRKYRAKGPVSTTFCKCLRQMIQSGQYIPTLKWTTMPTQSPHETIKRTGKLWVSCVQPQTITIHDIYHIFFGYRRKERYWNFTHPTEHMIADARTGRNNLPLDSDDESMPPLEHDDPDSDEPADERAYYTSIYDTLHGTPSPTAAQLPPTDDVNVPDGNDSPSRRPRYSRIAPQPDPIENPPPEARIEIPTTENEDDCEEIVDIDAYAREGVDQDEVARDLLDVGYTVLIRRPHALPTIPEEDIQQVNERDVPGLDGAPAEFISLH
ncbi:hypothetical protein R1sor_017109 [Riccia sorocarpa]|uniref:Replitron HUH endonuclease domain-containing protein n=1 Tax=Riccia sorocarpa TaxID=122646 RepID=A0ABD3I9W3_9MARC